MSSPEHEMSPKEWFDHLWRGEKNLRLHRWETSTDLSATKAETPFEREFSTQLEASQAEMETVYEGWADSYVEMHRRPLLASMSEADRQTCADLFVGLFPTFKIDAELGVTPRGDRIVMLHRAWPLLAEKVGRLTAHLTESREWSRQDIVNQMTVIRRMWRCEPIDESFLDIIDPQNLQDDVAGMFAMLGCSLFVLAHEYGHHLSGHERYTNDMQFNHGMEFEADQEGLGIFLRTWASGTHFESTGVHHGVAKEPLPFIGVAAPFMVLAVFGLLTPGRSTTHPAPEERVSRLLGFLPSMLEKTNCWPQSQIPNLMRLADVLSTQVLSWAQRDIPP